MWYLCLTGPIGESPKLQSTSGARLYASNQASYIFCVAVVMSLHSPSITAAHFKASFTYFSDSSQEGVTMGDFLSCGLSLKDPFFLKTAPTAPCSWFCTYSPFGIC